jgi:phage terminase large subunit GpA-like protein
MISAQQLTDRFRAAVVPPPRLSLSEWADRHFYLSAESSAEPGPWKTLPYQKGIMDAVTSPDVEWVIVMKSARVGYTKILNAALAYHVHQDPCPMMLVQPTVEDAEGYSLEEIAPMLRDCKVLAEIASSPASRDSHNTILHKTFPGGALSLVGANSPRGFRRVSRRLLGLDEIDGYPMSAGTEGDPVDLAVNRTLYYWNRKILAGSTPGIEETSRIKPLFEEGDQRRYYVPCPHCGHEDFFTFKEDDEGGHYMRWPKDEPEKAYFVCRKNGCIIEEKDKYRMIENGEWRASAPFNGKASFFIWSAYSYAPNSKWADIAEKFLRAVEKGVEALKVFVTTWLGQTWQDRGDAPEWKRLYQRREPYTLGTVPKGGLFLTAGVDVQKNRLVYEVQAWGRGKRSWSVDAGQIMGDVEDLGTNGPWPKLAELLDRGFKHERGTVMKIATMAVDSGAFTQSVYAWCRTKPMNRVMAVKGQGGLSKLLLGAASEVDVSIDGKKIARGYHVWPVGSDVIKSEFYGWLRLEKEVTPDAVEPHGYCHFPEYGEDFFLQWTAETLVSKKNKKGFIVKEWTLLPNRENHFLDARVYGRAAAAAVGLDRFNDVDWDELERLAGYDAKKKDEPAEKPPPAQPYIEVRTDWLKR